MNIERKVLATLNGVYSVSVSRAGGKARVLAASELPGGTCLLLPLDGGKATAVWEGPGGTMSLVPATGDRFYAVQQFYAGFNASKSIVVQAATNPGADSWVVGEKLKLPYLHRLAAVTSDPFPTLLACTLCAGKTDVDDWSQPGAVYRLATDPHSSDAWKPIPVIPTLHRNHGYCRTEMDGEKIALIGSMEGLFSIALPGGRRPAWSHQHLLKTDVSDAVALDWDGDGREELVTIEPFHGDRYVFYSRGTGTEWIKIHEMPCLLGHSLWAGQALGRPALILGERMGEGRIQVVFPTDGAPKDWNVQIVDRQTGGTNVTVVQATDQVLEFASANNDNNQVVLYRVTP